MKKDWTHENCSKCMVRRYNQSARISKWALRMEHRRPDPLYLIKPCVWECFWTSSTRKTGWIMATKSYKLQISLFAYFSSALGLVRRGKLEKKWCHKGGSCKSFASRSAFRFASAVRSPLYGSFKSVNKSKILMNRSCAHVAIITTTKILLIHKRAQYMSNNSKYNI